MNLTLQQLNAASPAQALTWLDGVYEHSPWIAERALTRRPFASVPHLQFVMAEVVAQASTEEQLSLVRAHPELAGKAMLANTLTAESTNEQSRAGLTQCTPDEFARIQQLNVDYNAKFGFPFILAVRGPRGTGLSKQHIIETFARRLQSHPQVELAECLRNIHRIAQLRLNDKFALVPKAGEQVWDWLEDLAQHSDQAGEPGRPLTVTYLTAAHQACAQDIAQRMRQCGLENVHVDAVGNVVGRYASANPQAQTLLTGSHFDTVRNGGKYDGRLGIHVPLAAIGALHQRGERLPFHIEVVAFAEEEGQRFPTSFWGSSALTGKQDLQALNLTDSDGVTLRQAMAQAGLPLLGLTELRRDPKAYLGFVEVHIEQGPVLCAAHLPLGIVTSINASVRFEAMVRGTACHAGTTPMQQRQDAAAATAEIVLAIEARARADGDSVGTVGQLLVPNGSVNVVPGACNFSIDLRAPTDEQRDRLASDVLAAAQSICERRHVQWQVRQTLRASAAPSAPQWQQVWERAVSALGLPLLRLPSGAGHDAMMLHQIMPQAMLFVRGENQGISHNPLESCTTDDIELAVQAFSHLLHHLAPAA